ncbi:MAG: YcbK family protein [Deltaproteobacteria bacterium]|nr:YcbK family protein [Deltaproteobacteria bacterium]
MGLWRDKFNRRKVLKAGLLGAATAVVPIGVDAAQWAVEPANFILRPATTRVLSFYNVHTGETLKTVYFDRGEYVPDALREVNYFFRDFRANQVRAIDPQLLDLLHRINRALDTSQPFNLISGYRSPATNAWLASQSEGVARHSLHMEGLASDINVQGRSLALLQVVALAMRGGGVGYYPRSNFVHVDTGRVRRW